MQKMFYVVDRLLDSEGLHSMDLGNLIGIIYFHTKTKKKVITWRTEWKGLKDFVIELSNGIWPSDVFTSSFAYYKTSSLS
jgi:hypothetical protein